MHVAFLKVIIPEIHIQFTYLVYFFSVYYHNLYTTLHLGSLAPHIPTKLDQLMVFFYINCEMSETVLKQIVFEFR